MYTYTVLLDVDGVIADYTRAFFCAYFRALGSKTMPAVRHRHKWDLSARYDLDERAARAARSAMDEAGAAVALRSLPGAEDGVRALLSIPDVDVLFVTSPPDRNPTWCYDRRQWLVQRFGRDTMVVFAKHKEYVRGDLIVDDYAGHVRRWVAANPKGKGVLWGIPEYDAEADFKEHAYSDQFARTSIFEMPPAGLDSRRWDRLVDMVTGLSRAKRWGAG